MFAGLLPNAFRSYRVCFAVEQHFFEHQSLTASAYTKLRLDENILADALTLAQLQVIDVRVINRMIYITTEKIS